MHLIDNGVDINKYFRVLDSYFLKEESSYLTVKLFSELCIYFSKKFLFFIESVFENNLLTKPNSIKSPSYPILINYDLNNYEIYH